MASGSRTCTTRTSSLRTARPPMTSAMSGSPGGTCSPAASSPPVMNRRSSPRRGSFPPNSRRWPACRRCPPWRGRTDRAADGCKGRGARAPEDSGTPGRGTGKPVRLADCSQPWNADPPPFPADEPPTVVWAKRLPSHGTNHQRISTQLHIGTHIDAPLHWREEGMDIAYIQLDRLYGQGVVADVSGVVSEF